MSIIEAQTREYMLGIAPKGRYRIISLPRGEKARHKCMVMGMVEGEIIEVIYNGKHSPIRVKVKGSELAIGHGLGFQIRLKRLKCVLPEDAF